MKTIKISITILIFTLFASNYYLHSEGTFREIFGPKEFNTTTDTREIYFKQFKDGNTHFPRRFATYFLQTPGGTIREWAGTSERDSDDLFFNQWYYGSFVQTNHLKSDTAYFWTDWGINLVDMSSMAMMKFKSIDRYNFYNFATSSLRENGEIVWNYLGGFVPIIDSRDKETYWYYADYWYIYKVNSKNPKELISKYKFDPLPIHAYSIYPTVKYNRVLFDGDSTIWVVLDHTSRYYAIYQLNIYTEEATLWNSENLPVTLKSEYKVDSTLERQPFVIRHYCIDPATKAPVFILDNLYQDSNNVFHCDNLLLYYKDGIWDTININPVESPYYLPDRWCLLRIFPIEKYGKIALIFSTQILNVWGIPIPHETRTNMLAVMFYDMKTRTYEYVKPPVEIFTAVERESDTEIPAYWVDSYTAPDGKEGVGILYQRSHFVQYIPENWVSIEENTEQAEGGIPDLWFRNVYPNPVGHNTVTADIMCYVKDISKVELGLYNLVGQKLLDLTNQFEYSVPKATIYVSFNMPSDLPKGVYYLNVRYGGETRTKPIVIGE